MRADTRTPAEKAADRNAKIDALQERLASAVESLATGEDWLRAMEFAARFRARSFNNTVLIWVQHAIAHAEGRVPDPSPTLRGRAPPVARPGPKRDKGQAGYQIFARSSPSWPPSTPTTPAVGAGRPCGR
jgi:hypothetical protein